MTEKSRIVDFDVEVDENQIALNDGIEHFNKEFAARYFSKIEEIEGVTRLPGDRRYYICGWERDLPGTELKVRVVVQRSTLKSINAFVRLVVLPRDAGPNHEYWREIRTSWGERLLGEIAAILHSWLSKPFDAIFVRQVVRNLLESLRYTRDDRKEMLEKDIPELERRIEFGETLLDLVPDEVLKAAQEKK